VWWQFPATSVEKTNLGNILNDSIFKTNENKHTPEVKQRNDVESQILPSKGTSPQKTGFDTEPFPENETKSIRVPCLNNSQQS